MPVKPNYFPAASANISNRAIFCLISPVRVVMEAMVQTWTRDPFDRIITATASTANAVLLTKDWGILDHYARAFWD